MARMLLLFSLGIMTKAERETGEPGRGTTLRLRQVAALGLVALTLFGCASIITVALVAPDKPTPHVAVNVAPSRRLVGPITKPVLQAPNDRKQ